MIGPASAMGWRAVDIIDGYIVSSGRPVRPFLRPVGTIRQSLATWPAIDLAPPAPLDLTAAERERLALADSEALDAIDIDDIWADAP